MYGSPRPPSHNAYTYRNGHAPGSHLNRAPGRPDIRTIANSIDGKLANDALSHYTAHMVPQMPFVAASTNAEMLRHTKPILFVAIMSVASVRAQIPLPEMLTHDLLQVLAELVFVNGEKSLELVQSLQVVAVWYWQKRKPPTFHQHVNAAAIMAMDLGFDEAPSDGTDASNVSAQISQGPADSRYETLRAWIGCYLLCSVYVSAFLLRALSLSRSRL